MSYHIYTTDGIILKRKPFGEANVLLHILTEDLGLILASATSARSAHSKLRLALQEYSYCSASLIKAKNGWKVTNVVEKNNFYFDIDNIDISNDSDVSSRVSDKKTEMARTALDTTLTTNKYHRVMAQIVFTILQMIQGEAPHPEIFQTVLTGFQFLTKTKVARTALATESDENIFDISNFEILAVLRILYHLGYVVSDSDTGKFLEKPNDWDENLLNQISLKKRKVVSLINKALQASQL